MKKILIVDDDLDLLDEFRSGLKHYPHIQAIFVSTNKEAMRALREHRESILAAIVNYKLPDAQTGQIISLMNAHNIASIVLTDHLNNEVKDIILKKNIVDFVLKNDTLTVKSALDSVSKILTNYDTTLLIVDDSKLSRELIKRSLAITHLNILEAQNGRIALEMIENEENNISLVITDFEMPEIDGIDLTFKLREKYTKAQLGIIAISAAEDEDTSSKFLKFGANDFINKPLTPSHILTTVNANIELLNLFQQIKDLANKDFLTGSYNRRYFFEVGNAIFLKAKRKEKPLAVAMIDIDNFKKINDTYGHDVGDVAIKEIKKLLDASLRASDLVARFGGEEFCIVLEDISLQDTEKLFEKIRKNFEDNVIKTHGVTISYTVSFGIAYGMANTLEEMVSLSDKALYHVKENGRNQVKIDTYDV